MDGFFSTMNKSAVVIEYNICNISGTKTEARLSVEQAASLRSCHSYNMKYPSDYESSDGRSAFFRFNDKAVENAAIMILSQGDLPEGCTIIKAASDPQHSPTDGPAARFIFNKTLLPHAAPSALRKNKQHKSEINYNFC